MRAALTLAALLASQSQAACLWTDPGANRFTGDPVAAKRVSSLARFGGFPPRAGACRPGGFFSTHRPIPAITDQ